MSLSPSSVSSDALSIKCEVVFSSCISNSAKCQQSQESICWIVYDLCNWISRNPLPQSPCSQSTSSSLPPPHQTTIRYPHGPGLVIQNIPPLLRKRRIPTSPGNRVGPPPSRQRSFTDDNPLTTEAITNSTFAIRSTSPSPRHYSHLSSPQHRRAFTPTGSHRASALFHVNKTNTPTANTPEEDVYQIQRDVIPLSEIMSVVIKPSSTNQDDTAPSSSIPNSPTFTSFSNSQRSPSNIPNTFTITRSGANNNVIITFQTSVDEEILTTFLQAMLSSTKIHRNVPTPRISQRKSDCIQNMRSLQKMNSQETFHTLDMEKFESIAVKKRFQNESAWEKVKRRFFRFFTSLSEYCLCLETSLHDHEKNGTDGISTTSSTIASLMELNDSFDFNEEEATTITKSSNDCNDSFEVKLLLDEDGNSNSSAVMLFPSNEDCPNDTLDQGVNSDGELLCSEIET